MNNYTISVSSMMNSLPGAASRQELLTYWIKDKYEDKKIRVSGEPYFIHLAFVAELAAKATKLGYEIGLCHDLLEDTETSSDELREILTGFNYTKKEANYITDKVIELTDVFTSFAYPDLNKRKRKIKEAERLLKVSDAAQTIKYADLIYNIKWTLQYEPAKAKKYLKKKKLLLKGLNKGEEVLRKRVIDMIKKELKSLTI